MNHCHPCSYSLLLTIWYKGGGKVSCQSCPVKLRETPATQINPTVKDEGKFVTVFLTEHYVMKAYWGS